MVLPQRKQQDKITLNFRILQSVIPITFVSDYNVQGISVQFPARCTGKTLYSENEQFVDLNKLLVSTFFMFLAYAVHLYYLRKL